MVDLDPGFGVAALLVAFGALALSTLNVVRADQRLVVFRYGLVSAVRGPGVALVVPGVEKAVRVPMRETRVDVLWQEVRTADGVGLTVNVTALMPVHDPVAYAERLTELAPNPTESTRAVVAEEIGRLVAGRTLDEVAVIDDGALRALSAAVSARTAEWGVTVRLVEISRIELSLNTDLIRWAKRFAGDTGRTR